MVVTIVSRCDDVRAGHRRLAQELSERLPKYFQRIEYVEWALDADGHAQSPVVHCNLHAHDRFYTVTATAATFSHAMHLAVNKLVEQRRRDKNRKQAHRRKAVQDSANLQGVSAA